MAFSNISINTAFTTTKIPVLSDLISGSHLNLTKIILGAEDENDGPVSISNPLPVLGTVTAIGLIDATIQTENVAHVGPDKGIYILAVRSDAGGSLVDTDGDFTALSVNASGELRVTGGGGGGGGGLGTLIHGQTTVATAGTAVLVVASQITDTITIKANPDNSGNIYVGDSGVGSANGYILEEGESISIDANHAGTNIFIDADTDGDGVSFIAARS